MSLYNLVVLFLAGNRIGLALPITRLLIILSYDMIQRVIRNNQIGGSALQEVDAV